MTLSCIDVPHALLLIRPVDDSTEFQYSASVVVEGLELLFVR